MFKVRGSGDTREVYDGTRLVGTIRRKSCRVVSWRITPTSATGRTTDLVWWVATHADGQPVRWGDGKRVCHDHMKDWTQPSAWASHG